jgi:hydrogenase maturation protease
VNRVETLVIACGNPLRGDDGIAHVAAGELLAWQMPGIRVLIVHQLMPELIEEMKQAGRVLFIDAAIDTSGAAFQVRSVEPRKSRNLFGHHESPENLLALLQHLERRCPQAWLLSVRTVSFDHGEGLTCGAKGFLDEAMAWLHGFLREQSCTKSV